MRCSFFRIPKIRRFVQTLCDVADYVRLDKVRQTGLEAMRNVSNWLLN
jgi:hypothetical protein